MALMACPTQRNRPWTRRLAFLLLLALPPVLLDRVEQLTDDSTHEITSRRGVRNDAPSFGLAPNEAEEDFEDDFDDILPHDFIVDSARASHRARMSAALLSSIHATQRLLRPPIG